MIKHIAIIMDGNGRWAKDRGLKSIEGHRKGSESVRTVIESASRFNIKYLTLYAFSSENWKRTPNEVRGLMELLSTFIDDNLEELNQQGISLRTIGDIKKLPSSTYKKLLNAIEVTKDNKNLVLTLALSYGSRGEIIGAIKDLSADILTKKIKVSKINETLFSNYLETSNVPDPDLLIRTSGEYRISNFLLWQISYSELYFTDVLWPDFNENDLKKAIDVFNKRNRRFGGR